MAVTAYATQSDLEFVWGQYGVRVRGDDDRDGALETNVITNALEVAAVKINHYLFARYAVATLSASAWVKWANAYMAAVILGKRRGSGVAAPIKEEADEYLEKLKSIKAGLDHLPADTGLASPAKDDLPSVSNFTIDRRFSRSKVRRVPTTSTRDVPGEGVKSKDSLDLQHSWT